MGNVKLKLKMAMKINQLSYCYPSLALTSHLGYVLSFSVAACGTGRAGIVSLCRASSIC